MHLYSEGWARAQGSSSTTTLNEIYSNYSVDTKDVSRSFSPFPRLPVELRSLIWKRFLQCRRLISITVYDEADHSRCEDSPQHRDSRNAFRDMINKRNYKFRITTQHLSNPLLKVCHESRQAALRFYRIHLPPARHAGGRQCYFNPEFDFIYLHAEAPHELLVDFIYDFKTADPKGVGILNLGIGARTPFELGLPMIPSNLEPPVLTAFKETLTGLHRVFFHHVVSGARMMFDELNLAEFRFNRAYPMTTVAETFDFIEGDPRPIDAYLDKVSLHWDPRSMKCLWQHMERNFGISRKPGSTEFMYHLTGELHPPACRSVASRADAAELLQLEHDSWRSRWEEKDTWFARGPWKDPDTRERMANAPIPAFGFWVLPLDAFGEVPDVPEDNYYDFRWDMKRVVSLERHRPKLAVFSLPG